LAKPVSRVEKEAYAYVKRRWGVAAGKGKK
jgi:hypothetical protein